MHIHGYVSVIVPVRDGAASVLDCLKAIAQQTYRPLEIIVVDDASSDPSAGWVRAFRRQHPEIPVTVVTLEVGRGVGAAIMAGLGAARGEFIAFAHQADVWHPFKLAHQMRALRRTPEALFALSALRLKSESGGVADVRLGRRVSAPRSARGVPAAPVGLSALLVRRAAVEAVVSAERPLASAGAPGYELVARLAGCGVGVRTDRVVAEARRPTLAWPVSAMSESLHQMSVQGVLAPARAARRQAGLMVRGGYQALRGAEPVRARECFTSAVRHSPWRLSAWLGLAGGEALLRVRPAHGPGEAEARATSPEPATRRA